MRSACNIVALVFAALALCPQSAAAEDVTADLLGEAEAPAAGLLQQAEDGRSATFAGGWNYIGYATATTHAKKKVLRRNILVPKGKRMFIGMARRHHELGYADWEVVDSSMRGMRVKMTVEGGAGRGKIRVDGYAIYAPAEWSDAEVKERCSFEVEEQKTPEDEESSTCTCRCMEADGTIHYEGAFPSPGTCNSLGLQDLVWVRKLEG